jgi:cytidylate kinase
LAGRAVVTIDGPAGAGKSTVARGLAARLGWRFLDTGAMYRAVAWGALRRGVDLADAAALAGLADASRVELIGSEVRLDGEDVTAAIRTPEVARASSRVASVGAVRERLVGWQRAFAESGPTVSEGRDQGTVVFPDAGCKVFLTASPEARAVRRHAELVARGEAVELAQVLRDQGERDERDSRRAVGPLRPAADALIVDTTGMAVEEVIALIAARAGTSPLHEADDPLPRMATAWTPGRGRLVAVGRTVDDATRAALLGVEGCVVLPPGEPGAR